MPKLIIPFAVFLFLLYDSVAKPEELPSQEIFTRRPMGDSFHSLAIEEKCGHKYENLKKR